MSYLSDQALSQTDADVLTDRRLRSLTEKGSEHYQATKSGLVKKIEAAWNAVQSCIDSTDCNKLKLSNLDKSYEQFLTVSQAYAEFLTNTNTAESRVDLETHRALVQSYYIVARDTRTMLSDKVQHGIDSASSTSEKKSHRSHSTNSCASSMSSILARKKAKAEAAKAKLAFTNKQVAVQKQQALLMRQQADLAADLQLLKSAEHVAETEAEVKTLELLLNGSLHDDSRSLLSLPQESSEERTSNYLEKCATFIEEVTLTGAKTIGNKDSIEELCHKFEPKPVQQISTKENDCDKTDGHPQQVLNPCAMPYQPISRLPVPDTSMASDMAQYLLKKDLLLTRLHNFNDQLECYASWKASFVNIAKESRLSAIEEMDLLIKWLGPLSSRQAYSLRTSNVTNPDKGLQLLWQRLDERYGAAEMVENALRRKLERFPKLGNKDTSQLYELSDILAEIQSVKSQENYRSILAYYDSSLGVNPIVAKLPYGIQEKWTTQASSYKRLNKVAFPPFHIFVNFIRDVSLTKNDPSFSYDGHAATVNQKKDTSVSKLPNTKSSLYSKKTTVSPSDIPKKDAVITKCPLHGSKHTLNACRVFRNKPIEERKQFVREHKICFKCCESVTHMARDCTADVKCAECQSKEHATALHCNSRSTPKTTSSDGGEQNQTAQSAAEWNSKCTQICGTPFGGKSCSKTILVNVYHRQYPNKVKQLYAVFDEQSNVSLARSSFFNFFHERGESVPYTLSSCNGRQQMSGRKAKDYVVESLDSKCKIDLPNIVECDQIPDVREEIPSPEVAIQHPHLQTIANAIPALRDDCQILLLIGRDIPEAHHVQEQITGPKNAPYAHRLPLGWVVVGETCLGKVHQPNYTVNKTYVLNDGRPSYFLPCNSELHVKEDCSLGQTFLQDDFDNCLTNDIRSDIFTTTKDDNKVGLSVNDREFLRIMENSCARGPDGDWVTPLPFKTPRPSLPSNRAQANRRAQILHNSLRANPTKRQHFFEFMDNIIHKGRAELAPPLEPNEECWYLPLFGVYHPQKPDRIRGVFDSSAREKGISLNDVLLKGPDLTNSLVGILMRFRSEAVAITADIEQMFYCFKVCESHRNYLRFFWYRDNNFDKELTEYRMTVHVFGNSPSPAVATFALRKAAEAGTSDSNVVDFVTHDFYVDDALKSLATPIEAINLLKDTQQALLEGGNIRLHKIVSNHREVMDAIPPDDQPKDLKDLDLGSDDIPIQRSLGLLWDIQRDVITFQEPTNTKPFTRRGVLSTINSLFDPIGLRSPQLLYGERSY